MARERLTLAEELRCRVPPPRPAHHCPEQGKLRDDENGSGPIDAVKVSEFPSGLGMTADEFFTG
ncbi:MAG: hypothetical protein GY798_16175 [Hyphomicrobiales bacterium]|nr:hypothetical protein [Hyphomicrobiales bacterium]